MSEFTKGKLEVSGKLPYIFATTAPPYRLSGETIISWGSETGGQDWPAIDKEIREANAKELARRWNAFEEGGLVDDICIQLMDLYSSCVDTATPEVYGTILGLHEKLETALAKS